MKKYWLISFVVASAIIALLTAHSFLLLYLTHENTNWLDTFQRSVVSWYLWAAFFPVIVWIAKSLRFDAGRRFRTGCYLLFVGIAIAMLHEFVQLFLNDYIFHPERNWGQFEHILKTQFLALFLTRFFICQAILTVCVAMELYRKARETEMRVAQMEAGILQAQVESLKIQLDPQDLFRKLKELSKLMYRDLDEAESMIAHMGDDLRSRLTPLAFNNQGRKELEATDLSETEPDQEISQQPYLNAHPVRKWLIIIGIFTLLAVYFTVQRLIVYSVNGIKMNWTQQLLDCTGWYIWGLLTPIALKFSAKFPIQRNQWPKLVLMHVGALISMWVVATFLMLSVRWAANLGELSFLQTFPLSLARSPLWLDIVCYSVIVAVESSLRYHQRFEHGKMRTVRLNAQLARARLQALKMQLHPHFLYNSLNSLSELMREDPVAGEEMIHNLESFLRLTVDHNEEQEILFERELEFLKCYLAIENVRFQDRLTVTMEIDPQALQVKVPNLLLQPIVENAIRHGIAPRSKPGQVEIQAKRKNGVLQLSVKDNGPGFRKTDKKSSGLGLANTRERLNQLYGESHHFELTNAPEGGLIVSLEIPVSYNGRG